MVPQLPPIFVKGQLSFEMDGSRYEFDHINISTFGVTGLSTESLQAKDHFGKIVTTQVKIYTPDQLSFQTEAQLIREFTDLSERLGMRFELETSLKNQLGAIIERSGFLPTDYVRKYPRIPSSNAIQTFPLRAQVMLLTKSQASELIDYPIVFDVVNLSPNGILLQTENQMALSILPKDKLDIVLEPRGWFPIHVRMEGMVCRIYDEVATGSFNLIRYLGVKFTKMDEMNRNAFLDLLRDILNRIKERQVNARTF